MLLSWSVFLGCVGKGDADLDGVRRAVAAGQQAGTCNNSDSHGGQGMATGRGLDHGENLG